MTKFDLLPPHQKAWYFECCNFQPEFHHIAAANCVDGLAEELADLQELAEEDEDFENLMYEWQEFIEDCHLSVLLEQSCDDGVMLLRRRSTCESRSVRERCWHPLKRFCGIAQITYWPTLHNTII